MHYRVYPPYSSSSLSLRPSSPSPVSVQPHSSRTRIVISSHPVLQLHHFDQKQQQHQQQQLQHQQQQLQHQQQRQQLSLAQVVSGVDYAHGNGGCGDGVGVGHEQLIHMPPSSDGTLTRKSATTVATGMLFRPPSPFPGQPLSMAKLIMLRHELMFFLFSNLEQNQRRPQSPPARRGLPSLPSARSRLVEEV
ncbi:hypothetical protein PNOK_0673500 [Pyrrhoderma noxium]|uniref:Uncharacterized protein n=1 Tax=Pyrrhoderma noxium TaxID=2282107 RepID=A0A286UFE8_9AGAM|nr:hypothetical protein PNOK_0673500 [Pyrrhoderma noxium]